MTLTQPLTDGEPSAEPSATTPQEELFERAREAVAALRNATPQRDAQGRVLPGSSLNIRHGLRSTQLLEQPDISAWHQERVAAITTDLGGDGQVAATASPIVRELARLEIIAAALGTELLEHGVLTQKGAMRAATTTYLQVVDRLTRLAITLGLERKAKPVNPLDAVRARVAEANK